MAEFTVTRTRAILDIDTSTGVITSIQNKSFPINSIHLSTLTCHDLGQLKPIMKEDISAIKIAFDLHTKYVCSSAVSGRAPSVSLGMYHKLPL